MLPAQTAAMAGRLVPALAAAQPDSAAPPLDSPVAVTRLYGAIADTLLTAARGADGGSGAGAGAGPGVVVVEDVHWADGSSLGLLAYLVRRLADWPLLLVLSWQPEQAARLRVLRTALGEAESELAGQVIEPRPLGAEAISALLELDGMPRIDVARLLEQTRGLPMLVREYVEALRGTQGAAGPPGQAPAPAEPGAAYGPGAEQADWWPPASVRELLRARLQAVSEPTLQILTAAAVLGAESDADLLRAVSGRGEGEIVEAIEEALGRSLLTENAPPASPSRLAAGPGAVLRLPLRRAAPDGLRIGHAGPPPAAAWPGRRHSYPPPRARPGHHPGRDGGRPSAAGRPGSRGGAVVVAGQ